MVHQNLGDKSLHIKPNKTYRRPIRSIQNTNQFWLGNNENKKLNKNGPIKLNHLTAPVVSSCLLSFWRLERQRQRSFISVRYHTFTEPLLSNQRWRISRRRSRSRSQQWNRRFLTISSAVWLSFGTRGLDPGSKFTSAKVKSVSSVLSPKKSFFNNLISSNSKLPSRSAVRFLLPLLIKVFFSFRFTY